MMISSVQIIPTHDMALFWRRPISLDFFSFANFAFISCNVLGFGFRVRV